VVRKGRYKKPSKKPAIEKRQEVKRGAPLHLLQLQWGSRLTIDPKRKSEAENGVSPRRRLPTKKKSGVGECIGKSVEEGNRGKNSRQMH